MVDQLNREPLYAQIEKLLLDRIRKRYRAGDLIPTQKELAEETGASLITVKRALAELGRRGLIESVRGRGTVVRNSRVDDNHADISSWTNSMRALGAEPRTAWVKIEMKVPDAADARLLGVRPGQKAVCIKRLRLIDREPICLMTNYLVPAMVPGLVEQGLDQESLYACLEERYRLRAQSAEEEVLARRASKEETKLLGAGSETVLVIRRRSILADGRTLEVATTVAPAGRYRYQVRLMAPRAAEKQRSRRGHS